MLKPATGVWPLEPLPKLQRMDSLGIEVDSAATVELHLRRIRAAGRKTREQLKVHCCYAKQSNFWVIDPDGVAWERYHVNYDLIEKHGGSVAAPARAPD